jgi:glucan phosphorylase
MPTRRGARGVAARRDRQRGGVRHADSGLARRARQHAAAWFGAADPLSLDDFNRGDHVGALAERVRLEAISRVLYPSDETAAGADLRLRQEYFFASASLQDLLRRHRSQHGELGSLADHVAIQLNDTHPAIAVPELMRLLVDEHGMPWDRHGAW